MSWFIFFNFGMMDYSARIAQLTTRLKAPLPGLAAQELMTGRVLPMPPGIPDDARSSAVLALLFPKNEELHLLFIRRTEDGKAHGGQISFPGGRQEPFDADLSATALREAQEEVGIMSGDVTILAPISSLYIPVSKFLVYPYIGFAAGAPAYNLSEQEVAEVLEVPVAHLFNNEHKVVTTVRPSSRPDMKLTVPAYSLPGGDIIWGATAMILSELEVIWNETTGD